MSDDQWGPGDPVPETEGMTVRGDYYLINVWVNGAAEDDCEWEFSRETAEHDITAFELAALLNITMKISDGAMAYIKTQPHLLRHFRRVPKSADVAPR